MTNIDTGSLTANFQQNGPEVSHAAGPILIKNSLFFASDS